MPYLVKVGFDKKNLYKSTSKGYHILRKDKKVIIRYGAIEVHGYLHKVFTWYLGRYTKEEKYPFSSIEKAKQFITERIKIRVRHGYNRLHPGTRIHNRQISTNE